MDGSGQLYVSVVLPPGQEPPSTHWMGSWLGPRTGMDAVAKRKKSYHIYIYIYIFKLCVRDFM
jgi:hypothetical protein